MILQDLWNYVKHVYRNFPKKCLVVIIILYSVYGIWFMADLLIYS